MHGDASLLVLAQTYGVDSQDIDDQETAADLLKRQLGRQVVVGDRVRFGKLRLTIRQMDGADITVVGIKLQS